MSARRLWLRWTRSLAAATFLHGDVIGSTRGATDATGDVVGTWDYSAFGVVTAGTGGMADDGAGVTRFLFAGEYRDDSGLYYLRARYYDPETASFLSVDPALAVSGSAYGYASGNPLQLVDPLGLFSLSGVGNWIEDHKGEIIGAVVGIGVTVGCLAATAGAGSVACAALGGAAAGATTYAINTPRACWNPDGFFKAELFGAAFGGLTAGVGNVAAPVVKSFLATVAGKLAPAAESGLARVITALPRVSSARSAITSAVGKVKSEIGGRLSAGRLRGTDAGEVNLGGVNYSDDEIAQLAFRHVGAGADPARPTLDEISTTLAKGNPVAREGRDAVTYEYDGVRVIVNEKLPWRSTAYRIGRS